jgi:hypothetical protein
MRRTIDQPGRKRLTPDISNIHPVLSADFNGVPAWRLSADGVHAGRAHFNVLAISQKTAKKAFRNGTSADIPRTNEKDAFHNLQSRERDAISD